MPPRDQIRSGAVEATESDIRLRSQDLGLVGKIFGSREHAPINIAGAIIVLGLLGLLAVPFMPSTPEFTRGDMAKAIGALILAAMTFLGGYLGSGKTD